MDSPTSPSDTTESSTRRFISRSAGVMDSFRGFGLSAIGIRVEKEELRSRILIPQYLRISMRDCIHKKDIRAGELHSRIRGETFPPESPIVVFVNGRSGGRNGPLLKERLLCLMDEDQIFDLSEVKPNEFVQYALGCLEHLTTLGDDCAKETREKMRVVVAGGDGTVGWVLGSLGELFVTDRGSFPPVAIIPLGTGNDLARTFGWGGTFSFAWKSAVKKAIYRATSGPVCHLDSWHMSIQMPSEGVVDPPHSLKSTKDACLSEGLPFEGKLPEKVHFYEGVFYNYFSIGMDAQVAYGFHQLRNEKPYLAQGPVANKIIYSGYSCTQGWFLTPCMNDPSLRGLKNIVRMYIRKIDSSEWELIHVPKSVRAIVALNLHNYGSGRNPWGNLSPEYLEKRGFVEPQVDDGLLEIFGLKQGWHASFVMVELISAKHIAQAASIRLELRGGEWKDAYLQMDGEPWKQPLSQDYSTFLEIKRVPYQSVMVSGE